MEIGMVIFNGMTNLDFAAPLDVLARMPGARVHVLARDLAPVVSDIGIPVLPTARMAEAPELDLLFIGGGPGINALMEDEFTLAFFSHRAPRAQWVTSVCTGALVLGAAGLLQGYKAATHWSAMDLLPFFGATPTHQRVVIDRNRMTGGGVTAGIDFGLQLLTLLHGEKLAQMMELGMEYTPEPPFGCGHPVTASAALLEAVREMTSQTARDRLERAARISARFATDAARP